MSGTERIQPEPMDLSEQEDIVRARGGDGAAFRRILERHQPDIARLMWRFSRDPLVHSELVQEAFVQAYMSLNSYRGHGAFAGWLKTIAVRVGTAHWRDRKKDRHVPLDDAAAQLSAPESQSPTEAAELVEKLLAALPERDRLVLTLMYLEGKDVNETAELTGWSRTMVKVQAWRARSKLKKKLESMGLAEGGAPL